MIQTKDTKRSLVIPKWIPLSNIIRNPENLKPRKFPFRVNPKTTDELNAELKLFRDNPNKFLALDILSSAIVLDDKIVIKEINEYLTKINSFPRAIENLIRNSLDKNIYKYGEDINTSVSILRKKLNSYPKNPLLWLELGRLNTIKGHYDKANRCITIAISLAPYERYIVRSAFRYYLHIGDFDKAYYYAKRAADFSSDPFLKSIEVNGAILNDMKLSKIKKINLKLIPINSFFQYSELIESIGMIDLKLGNDQKAKKNFRLAWSEPTSNVVSHAEWIIRNRFPAMLEDSNLDFSQSFEAQTWRHYYNLELDRAIISVRQWILEEQYSSHPFLLGSSLLTQASNPQEAINIATEGLIANPDDLPLKNNLAYAYLINNDVSNAELILDSFPKDISDYDRIFYYATKGLLEFKKRNVSTGRQLYNDSIELSQRMNEIILSKKALLNLAIAEFESKNQEAILFAKKVIEYVKNSTLPDIRILVERLEKLINLRIEKEGNY